MIVLDTQQVLGYLLHVSHKVSLRGRAKTRIPSSVDQGLPAECTNKSCLGVEMESYQKSSTPFLGIHIGTSETVLVSSAVALATVAGWTGAFLASHPPLLSSPSIAVAL